jgi:hypothetical protein
VKITILSPLWENKVDFSRPPMLFSLAEFGEKTGQNTTTRFRQFFQLDVFFFGVFCLKLQHASHSSEYELHTENPKI